MSGGSVDTLIRMANQISDFFKGQPGDIAVAETAKHLKRFWDPRMRRQIVEHLDHGGEGLKPITAEAVATLREAAPADVQY